MKKNIVTVAVHKGGTGKTTLAIHLGLRAEQHGFSVLIVDMDSQANTSHFFDASIEKQGSSSLFSKDNIKCGYHLISEKVSLLVADQGLYEIDRLKVDTALYYRKNLQYLAKDFDLVVIDTPPTMGFGMLAPLIASDFVISPIVPDAYSVAGVKGLFDRIKMVRAKYNPRLKFLGLVINRWNSRNKEQTKTVATLISKLKGHIIKQSLGDRTAIANAAYRKKAVFDKPSGGAAHTAAKEMRIVCDVIIKTMKIGEK